MKTKAKILSLLLAICLVAGLMPMTALAGTPTKAHVKAVFSNTAETAGADSQICAATVKDENESFVLHYVYSSDCIWNVQLFNRMRDGLEEPYKSLIPVLEKDDDSKNGFLFLSDDQYKDMDLDWSDPAAVAGALVPGSGTVATEENTSSVFSSDSTDIIDDYCSDYDEKVVEFINEIGETITRPTGANIIEAVGSAAKGGPYYIVEDGMTKECYDVVIFLHVSEISAYTATKEAPVFTATGDNSGTLSNVVAEMEYSTDGGENWTEITGTTVEITGVTADKDIQVRKGDDDVQTIDVTQAARPAGIGKTDCTTAAQNDGTITGVDSTMEYRLSTASEWTPISGNTVTGLENGTYFVRVKASGTVLASAAAKVSIREYVIYLPIPSNNYVPILAQAQNGAFTVSPGAPLEGSKVTISPKPDEGFELAHISAVDGSGAEVRLLRDDDGSYYFIQPDSRVTITVTFRAVSDVSDCPGDASCLLARFSDVDMHAWYHDGLHYCVENGLMSGMDDNSFAPNGTMTRAMVWTILARLDGVDAEGGAAWYSAAQQWATENGISDGTEPMVEITREQLAAILYRYELYRGRDVSAGAYDGAAAYPDYAEVSGYAVAAMDWAVSSGIINGADGLLAPQAGATRAQAATLLMRFIER